MMDTMHASFILDARSLLSKFGFGDGSALGDWWLNSFDELPMFDETAVLCDLVRKHLVPAVEAAGHSIEVEQIVTSHNPIRASVLNGEDVDCCGETDMLEGIWVALDRETVVQAVREPSGDGS